MMSVVCLFVCCCLVTSSALVGCFFFFLSVCLSVLGRRSEQIRVWPVFPNHASLVSTCYGWQRLVVNNALAACVFVWERWSPGREIDWPLAHIFFIWAQGASVKCVCKVMQCWWWCLCFEMQECIPLFVSVSSSHPHSSQYVLSFFFWTHVENKMRFSHLIESRLSIRQIKLLSFPLFSLVSCRLNFFPGTGGSDVNNNQKKEKRLKKNCEVEESLKNNCEGKGQWCLMMSMFNKGVMKTRRT